MTSHTFLYRVKTFISNWPGLWTVPAGLTVWFLSPYFLRLLDPTAGCFDAGVLQVLLFAFLGTLMADFVAWFLILLSWPTISQYVDLKQMAHDWFKLEPKTRVLCTLAVFAFHFLGFCLLCRVL